MKLYKPVHHKPPSGLGYEGAADPWSSTLVHAPYEPSFITIPEFPDRRFWTWGIFALLEQVGEEVLAELRADGWEPWTDETRELFLFLESQFAQTLIVVEAQGGPQRYWARTADIQHAQRYPVLLTYQSGEEKYPHAVPPEMIILLLGGYFPGSSIIPNPPPASLPEFDWVPGMFSSNRLPPCNPRQH